MSPKLVSYSSYLIYIAALAGILFPNPALNLGWSLKYLLTLVMTFSIIDFQINKDKKKNVKEGLKLTLIHYLLLSSIYIIISFFMKDAGYKEGFILLAIMPPAAGLIAIAKIKHGKVSNSFLGLLISYLTAFIYAPLVLFLTIKGSIDLFLFLRTLVLFIIAPFLISRILRKINWRNESMNTILVNFFYALLFYVIVGLKRDIFISQISSLWPIFAIMTLVSFGLGTIIFTVVYRKKDYQQALDYTLFGTYKNTALGLVIAASLFSPAALIPISVRAFISPVYTIYIFSLRKLFDTFFNMSKVDST